MRSIRYKYSIGPVLFLCGAALAQATIPYTVHFRGITDEALVTTLRNASEAVARVDRPPASILILRKRVEDDVARLREVLAGAGYFGSRVTPHVDEAARPVRVMFSVATGPQYKLAGVDIAPAEGAADIADLVPAPAALGLETDAPVGVAQILAARDKLRAALRHKGYPYPKIREPEVTVDHQAQTVRAGYQVDPGPFARMAAPEFEGVGFVKEAFLRRRVEWQPGDAFDMALIEKTRDSLLETELFSTISIKPAGQVAPDGTLAVGITGAERPPRTVELGVSYMSDTGPGAHVAWEHRNLYQEGKRLALRGAVSAIEYSLSGVYTVPDFVRRDQLLRLEASLATEDTDAYESNRLSLEADIERRLTERLTVGTGLAFRASNVEQFNKQEQYYLLSVPGFLTWDTRDSVLDPTRGGLLTLRAAPTLDVAQPGVNYLRTRFGYTRILKLSAEPRVLLAGRIALGSILGAEADEVSPDDRFYAGGGGSVRGYGYQLAGPVRDGEPVGGRSLLEFSTELRVKVTERIGIVTFVDGGSVFPAEMPRFDSRLLFGAGAGVRYFSPIGPFRFDLAFPLDRREDIDDAFQVYLSMGQAF